MRLDGALLKRFTIGGPEHGQPPPAGYAGSIPGDARWELYAHEADANLDVRFPAKAGRRVVGISFVRRSSWEPEGVLQPRQIGNSLAQNERIDGNPGVGSVTITGPFGVTGSGDTPSRRRIFSCRPTASSQEEGCARTILATLARRAYRRPVDGSEVGTLLEFYRAGRREGSFEAGIQHALERLLCSPEFLFRIERDPAGAARRHPTASAISIWRRACRFSCGAAFPTMSSWIWPRGEDCGTRSFWSDRCGGCWPMPGRSALVKNFASQWLVVRNVRNVAPDGDLFPEFDENLREALERETELFVDHIIREDRNVLEFLTADYTFVNERLARHYEIPNVYGNHFRRVAVADPNRRGLLGQGSILMVTAYPDRTSPVLRGKWLLDNVLGAPPPPPPPDVDTSLTEYRRRRQADDGA